MATNDLQRAATLANLFATSAGPADVPPPEPAEQKRSTAKTSRRKLAVVEDDQATENETAVADAVGVLETVITIPTDAEADELHEAAEAAVVDVGTPLAAAKPEPSTATTVDVDLVAQLTTKLGLKGAADRHNIPVSQTTGKLLQALDKELATGGRPIVSRNALITAAARKVIADPAAYASAPGRDPREPSTAIQGRVPAGLPADLRAAAYSVDPPLVVAHAMAAAVEELLEGLTHALKKSRRGRQ